MSTACIPVILSRRASFAAGLLDVAPILLSALPFGIICGVGALEAGMSAGQALLFSLAVFAGSSQLIATQFLASGAPTAVVVLAALAVNLRFLMYSAAISPEFSRRSLPEKLGLSYLLTDQAFAISMRAYAGDRSGLRRTSYYLGTALGLFLAFQLGNLLGISLGSGLPAHWGIEFSVPLIFCALLTTAIRKRSMAIAAAVAALGSLLLCGLPYMLGVFIAALLAIIVGFLLEEKVDAA
ncbi:AzlC family ABC transporter permease [bacterium]|nr:AzlC family ABC transporter permease [bacterium]